MSSLANQLAARTTLDSSRLATANALKNPPSFIYTPRHAASISTADLHSIASNAWDQLSTLDPFFEKYHDQILGEEAKGTDRSSLTKEENVKLGNVLNKVMRALGRHMLLKPAGVVLEWLVRRFRVNDLNAGELIALFLPYHTTSHFPSALNLISEPVLTNSPYVALIPARKSLAPLPLDALIALLPSFSSVVTARPFLDFILQLPLGYLRADEKPHRALVAFWLQAVAGYIERAGDKIPVGEAASVLAAILEVLRLSRDQPDPLIASYILLARYSLHNPFAEDTLRTIMKTIVTNRARQEVADEDTDAAFVTTLVVIAQLGVGEIEVKEGKRFLGGSGWKGLTKINHLDDLLVQLCNQYDAERFMTPFLRTLTNQAATDESYLPLLTSLLTPRLSATDAPLLLPNRIVALLTSSALSVLLAGDVLSVGLVKVLNQVYQRWPTVWESETKQRIEATELQSVGADDNVAMKHLWHVMNSVLSGTSADLSQSGTSMFLSASSPDSTVRLIALKELLATPDAYSSNPAFVHDTLLARLAEPDSAITGALLSLPATVAILHEALSADEILTTILRFLETPKLPVDALSIALQYIARPYLVAHPEQADRVLAEVFLGRLLVSKVAGEERAAGFKALKGSPLESHAWIAGIGSHLLVDWSPKTIKIPANAVETNAAIVSQISQNLVQLSGTGLHLALASFVDLISVSDNFEQISVHKASAQLLATLVCAQVSDKLADEIRVAFVAKIIIKLRVESLGVSSLTTREDAIYHDNAFVLAPTLGQSVVTHAHSSKTLRRLQAALLSTSVASIRPLAGSAWSWLAGKATAEITAYRSLVASIYFIGNTAAKGSSVILARSILASLFTNILGDDLLAFLASIWTDSTVQTQLRCNALQDAATFVKGVSIKTRRDFQMVLPAVFLALQSETKSIRVAALEYLVEIKGALPTATAEVYGRDIFYGLSSASVVQYLDFADIANYVSQVLESRVELSLDGSFSRTFHQSRLLSDAGSKKKATLSIKVATFIVSHVATWANISARTHLLRMLAGLTEPAKGNILIPLLAEVTQATHKQRTELFEGVATEILIEYARLLLQPFDTASRKWIESTETKALTVFSEALEIKDTVGAGAILRKEALVVVRSSVFATARGDNRLDLFKRLVRLAAVPETKHVADILAALRGCVPDPTTITAYFNDVRATFAGPVSKGAKRGRTSVGNVSRIDRVSELVVALESIDFKVIAVTHGLILALFELLSALMEISTSSQVDIQYPGQLMLATLSTIIQNVTPESGITSDSIRMSPVLDFMRASTNPQTSHQALLLLAQLGPLVPNQLVHNVMPIFTFMGANVLQRDDAYSLRVVERTLESIIPALVASMKVSSTSRDALVTDLRELLRVFTDAATHVPRHRRTKLFVRFVETLGAQEFLSAVSMLLLEKAGQTSEAATLPLAVVESFSVDVQLTSFKQVIEEVSRLARNVEGGFLHVKLDDAESTSAQAVTLVSFLSIALDAKQLVAKVDAARAGGQQPVDTALSEIVRGLLDLSALDLIGATSTERQEFTNVTTEALQAAVRLMSTQSFSEAIMWLLELVDPLIRSSALVLLRSRLPTIKSTRREDVSPAVVAVVNRIQSSFADSSTDVENALATLDVVASSIFPAEDAALAKTVPSLIEVASRVSISNTCRSLVLSIIQKLSNRLGPRLIPLVSKVVPFAVSVLRAEANDQVVASRATVTAGFEILEGLFNSIPTFIGGQLDHVFEACLSNEIMHLTAVKDSAAAKARAALLATASRKLPAKTVYPAIIRLHAGLDGENKSALLGLLDILNRALRQGKTNEIADNYRPIFKLFLTIFDLRREHSSALSLQDIAEIEESALAAFVQFILKLNETTFKPLFLRTYDWAVIDLAEDVDVGVKHTPGLSARRTVLYKLVDRLLVQLRSIMVPFFSFMLDQTIDLLESFASGELRDSSLWSAVTSATTKALDYDESGFWTPLRLSKLSSALATQLSSPHPLSAALITGSYHPLLTAFARSIVPHDLLLKEFNSSLLMLTRSDDLRTKRSALEALEQLWETLGDSMLQLVPETTPFLAETIEESEGGVELVTRRLIATIELSLGESLEDFLNN